MITKQDAVSVGITFLVGLLAGGYLYVVGFASFVTSSDIPTAEEATALVIVGDLYGGCRNLCSSFQVQANGSYRLLRSVEDIDELVIVEGSLPLQLQRKLRKALTEAELERQSKTTNPNTCSSYSDGLDAVYDITLNGERYTLDSCGTSVDGQSSLWQALDELWVYFDAI